MSDLWDLLMALGAGLGILAFLQVHGLKKQVNALRKQLQAMESNPKLAQLDPESATADPVPTIPAHESVSIEVEANRPNLQFDNLELDNLVPPEKALQPTKPSFLTQQNWMVWLGGICVALAGIFMARYAMEQGLLGPGARIALGLLTGLALHGVALVLRVKTQQPHPTFAALAGGSSIILFAVLLAALHWYHMLSVSTVFVLLAGVGLATTWLALLHGPLLAAIGMIGAYAVPLLVATGSGNTLAAMGYALIISAAVLFLLRSVYRNWLWWGLITGGFLWWALSFVNHRAEDWRAVYLMVFGYGLVAIPTRDWVLNNVSDETLRFREFRSLNGSLFLSLVLVALGHCVTLYVEGWSSGALFWLGLPLLLLWVAGRQAYLTPIAWLIMLGQWLVLLLLQIEQHRGVFNLVPIAPERYGEFFQFVALMTALFCGMALHNNRLPITGIAVSRMAWSAMLTLTPVLALVLAFLVARPAFSDSIWTLWALTLGAIFIYCATLGQKRQWSIATIAWMYLGGHFAYGVAATFLLEQAHLTLALAAQIISLAWALQKFQLPVVPWILKAVTTLVVIRLTLNPWLLDYPSSGHWTLWTYGGSVICCLLGMRYLREMAAYARWLEGAALHLFVLTIWSEIRYWLYDGEVFIDRLTFLECSIYGTLMAALALVYHFRAGASRHLRALYQCYSWILLGLAACSYMSIILATLMSLSWAWRSVASTPVFNVLLLSYGGPVIMSIWLAKFYEQRWRTIFLRIAAVSAFVFISVEIRHLWTGSIRLDTGWSNAELYTYSVVWLSAAVAALLGGSWRWGETCYRGGMVLLAIVIVKIFLVDMHDLTGLLRIASFMGLGLALLGVAYLHQKLQGNYD